ncbi:hypothetical protein [uncultured Stenotrophomonas sp.]|uniref:hypothetical protein n=1 Tax=uncultured Stenotrophomonas sp. TaxID=165438 RepID=UPI002600E06B|nr:hypothetical protein [uncultured Stenotrophomonas sp.]
MSKDAALDGSEDFRDRRSLAVAISVALDVAAFGWMSFLGDQAGRGESEVPGFSGTDGTFADFLAPDEFRQRIEINPEPPSHEVTATSEETLEGAPSEPAEPAVDLPDSAESGDPATYPASDATAVEENETVPTESLEASLTQGGDSAGDSNDDLRVAYPAALLTAIRLHWNYQGPPRRCSLTIKQSPSGVVQSAVAGSCALTPQERRSLEAAALIAQPLPYEEFERVFSETTILSFE